MNEFFYKKELINDSIRGTNRILEPFLLAIAPLFFQLELLMYESSLQTSNISHLLVKTSFPFFSSTTITEFLSIFSSRIILDNSFSMFF